MFIYNTIAQTPTINQSSLIGNITNFLPIILMFIILYFLMIRPQMKRQKEQKIMIEALHKGDEIVTSGGLLGKIIRVLDTYVILEISESNKIIIQKTSIATLLPKGTLKELL